MSKSTRLQILRNALTQLRDEAQVPEHLVKAAIALHRETPAAEVFHLLAAASEAEQQGLICASQSGLWTLEIFVTQSPDHQPSGRGQLLLSVHADHRATYEGRTARIFINTQDGVRVLAEDVVRAGELFADIDLTGLELHRRDAVNIMFSAGISS